MENSVDNYLETMEKQLISSVNQIDNESIEKAVKIILDCEKHGGRVHVTGIGKPAHVAGYIASLLSSTGTPAYELHGTEAVHGSAGQVKAKDVVIAISNSGNTHEDRKSVV